MRKSAIGTRVSLGIVGASVIIILIGFCSGSFACQNIGYSVLGSGIVSFVITISEYFTVKRQALEEYYLAAVDVSNQFVKCQFASLSRLDFALAELKWYYDGYPTMRELFKCDFREKYRDLIEEICSLLEISSAQPRDDKLIEYFLDSFEKRDKELRVIMAMFSSLSKYERREFEKAYVNLYYLLDVRHKRKEVYNDIHKPIQEKHYQIKKLVFCFDDYLSGAATNAPAAYDFLKKAINELYETKEVADRLVAYSSFTNKIRNAIEKFRCDIYNQEYHPIKNEPIYEEL